MARKILIVDDNIMNRQLLKHVFSKDYDIAEAANGEEALAYISRNYKTLSAVLLDIVMPIMDGYEVLRRMRENPMLAPLPVIVVTGSEDESSRVKALSCGANDFIIKPYSPEIIKHCLHNNIALRETASIINAIQRDKLTGIYNREYFFQKVDELIKDHEPETYILACFDLDNFKLINDQFGTAEGDRILRYVGAVLKKTCEKVDGVCGRISGDNFATLYPNTPDAIEHFTNILDTRYLPQDIPANLFVSVGRYIVADCTIASSVIYDRAYIAKQTVKGRYDKHIAYFDDSMLEALVKSQRVSSEMDKAIAGHQFEVWFQPQYNHAAGTLVGAEALVRWRHPQRGLIPPGEFIPVFEQNGFIYELDKYVWEDTCRYLRKWIDEGRDPLPVSVNISRYDVFKDDLIEVLTGLVQKYELPVELLRLEITESAFSKSTDQIVTRVKEFIALGFTVEIDDFGSGYSSLNTLKDVPAQILKLDMRFLNDVNSSSRSGNILESIVRMAKWLDMSVIAEGVETKVQADFLESVGCVFVQGYYYAKPMPASEYEELAEKSKKEKSGNAIETIESLIANDFWDPASMDTLIFSSYVGGACVVEYTENKCEMVRLNRKYLEAIRTKRTSAEILCQDMLATLTPEDSAGLMAQVEQAAMTGEEFRGELWKTMMCDTPVHSEYIRYIGRVIAQTKKRKIVYFLIENITKQKKSDEQLRFLNDASHDVLAQADAEVGINGMLKKLLSFFEAGRVYVFEFDYDARVTSNTYEVCAEGVTSEIELLQNVPFEVISIWLHVFDGQDYVDIKDVDALPDDRPEKEILQQQNIKSVVAVPLRRDGVTIGFIGVDDTHRNHSEVRQLVALGDYISVMLTRRDYETRLANNNLTLEQMMRDMPGGYVKMRISDTGVTPVFINEEFCRMCAMTHSEALQQYGDDAYSGVHPDDVESSKSIISEAIANRATVSLRVRLARGKGGYVPVQAFYRVTEDSEGGLFLNGYYSDAEAQDKLEAQRAALLDNLPEGAALCELDGEKLTIIHLNKRYRELVGGDVVDDGTPSFMDYVHGDDREAVIQEMFAAIAQKRNFSCDVRMLCGGHGYRPFHISAKIVRENSGKYLIYASYTPIADEVMSYQEMLPIALSTVIGSSPDMAFIKDKSLRYVCCNDAMAQMLGMTDKAEIAGKTDYDLLPAEYADEYREGDKSIIATGQPKLGQEAYMPNADCAVRFSLVSKYPLLDPSGQVIGLYGVLHDTTEERNSNSRFQFLAENIPGGIATFEISPRGTQTLYVNEGFYLSSGYSREEYMAMTEKDPFAWIVEEDREGARAAVKKLLQSKSGSSIGIYRSRNKTGECRWFSMTGSIYEQHGDTRIVNTIKYDITEQMKNEQKLRESESQLKLVTDNVPGGIMTYDRSPDAAKITYFNDGFCQLCGMERGELEKADAKELLSRVYAEELPALKSQIDRQLRDGTPVDCEYRIHTDDGKYKWIRHKAEIISRQSGNITIGTLLLDVTEKREASIKLRISAEENRLAVMQSGNVIARFDVAARTLTAFPEIAKKFGIDERLDDVPYGQVRQGVIAPGSERDYIELYEGIAGGSPGGEAVFRCKTAENWRWNEANYSTVFNSDGKPDFAIISFRDVTEKMEKEAIAKRWKQSMDEKKPGSYTLLKCNISKDASYDQTQGTLLSFEAVPEQLSFNERARDYTKQCVYEADRDRYLAFANSDVMLANYCRGKRYDELEYRSVMPDGGVRWIKLTSELLELPNSTDIAAYLLYEDINDTKREELQTKKRAETDPLTGVLNRTAFIEKLEQRLRRHDDDSLFALLMLDLDGFKQVNDNFGHIIGDETLIEVGQKLCGTVRESDFVCRLGGDEFLVCLCGIPDKAAIAQKARQICSLLHKSFSLEVQLSTSMGIAVYPYDGICFDELYRRADLALYHMKREGKDSFEFYSGEMGDTAPDTETVAEPEDSSGPVKKLKRRMLIAEDNEQNRELLTNIFKEQYIVDTVGNGSDALIRLRRYGSAVSVVLLDLMMPGMDGFAVLERMQKNPELQSVPVVVVSGLDERETCLRAIRCGASDYITKPVDAELLRLRVASAVAKAENDRLRAENRYLAIQNDDVERYRSILKNAGTVFAEYRASDESFVYDKAISDHIAGSFDDRALWDILVADNAADKPGADAIKELVSDVLEHPERAYGSITVTLRTPDGVMRPFTVNAIERSDRAGSGAKVVLSFTEKAQQSAGEVDA